MPRKRWIIAPEGVLRRKIVDRCLERFQWTLILANKIATHEKRNKDWNVFLISHSLQTAAGKNNVRKPLCRYRWR